MNYHSAFPINKTTFKPDEQIQINRIISSLNEYFTKIGLDNFFESPNFDKLNNVKKIKLEEIKRWDKILKHLTVISYKIEITREFKILKELVIQAKEKAIEIDSDINRLEEKYKARFSESIIKSSFFSNLFTYEKFKETFEEMSNNFSKNSIDKIKKNDIFDLLRKKIIGDQLDIEKRIINKETIHINEIKDNHSLYELLSSEFLVQLGETMGMIVPYGKKSYSEIIKPSHHLAPRFKLKHTEVIFLSLSLHPLGDSELSVGDQVHLQNLTFDITKNQQVVEREMFHTIKFDEKNGCNIIVPIYFSFIKANLIREQRI